MTARSVTRLRDFDPLLLLATLGLVGLGTLLIYSGSLSQFGEPASDNYGHPVVRQVAFAAVGLLLALCMARLDYRVLGTLAAGLYIASIAALVFVLFAGDETYGSRRWIEIGGTPVQPSEIAKVILIIALAKYLSDQQPNIRTLRVMLTSLAIAAIPAALVFAQPDLGSAIIFGAIWLGMVAVAGVNWRYLMLLLGGVAVSLPFLFMTVVSDYQRERISLWLNPDDDPLGLGFQSEQAKIGIGSGGVWGKGLTEGSQTQLDYLRTHTTDYIFSVLGEELGFAGAVLLLALFVVLLWRGLRVAELSPDMFGRLMATGLVIFVLLQAFINIGVNIGLLPVTGIPLPFVSQGGSSLITLFIGIGILQSIVIRHRPFTFRDFYDR
jgi:rod shape determining protein RodA